MPRRLNGKSIAALAALALIAAFGFLSARSAPSVVSPPLEGGGRGRGNADPGDTALLAKYYPAKSTANSATRYFRIAPVAEGFAPADMQPSLNTPGSRWRNPAKTVQPVFPKTFNNP